MDYAALDTDRVVKFVEVKQSKHASDTYDTFIVDLSKCMFARVTYETSGIPVVLAVRFTDCLMCYPGLHSVTGCKVGFLVNGKQGRDYAPDKKPVVYIPLTRFVSPEDAGEVKPSPSFNLESQACASVPW